MRSGGGSKISDQDQRQWEGWAHDNLIEVQHLIDDVGFDSSPKGRQLKAELSSTADELVQVHGLISGGLIKPAISAVRRLEQRAIHARQLACTPS